MIEETQGLVDQLINSVAKKAQYQTVIRTIGYDVKLPDGVTLTERINKYEKIIQECKTKILFDSRGEIC